MKQFVVEYTDRDGRKFHMALEAETFEDAERRLVLAVQTGEVLEFVDLSKPVRGLNALDWFFIGVLGCMAVQGLWGLF